MSEISSTSRTMAQQAELEERYKVAREGTETIGLRLVVDNNKAGEMVIKMSPGRGTLFIEEIQIEKEYRRRGFGTQLVRHAEEIARSYSLARIELRPYATDESSMSTSRLRQWYSSIGYAETRKSMYKAC